MNVRIIKRYDKITLNKLPFFLQEKTKTTMLNSVLEHVVLPILVTPFITQWLGQFGR